MRKVLFKKWNPKTSEKGESGIETIKPGYWDDEFKHEGVFHQWGSAYEEFESGPGNYTVAIVEESDGTVSEIIPSNIRFIEPIVMDEMEGFDGNDLIQSFIVALEGDASSIERSRFARALMSRLKNKNLL